LAPLLQPWELIAAGTATVVAATLPDWRSYLALITFCVLASATYLVLLVYTAFRPGAGRAVLAGFSAWMGAHTDQAVVAGALILGWWLIAHSVYLIVT
jgi:hypothetical protein